MGWWGGLVRWVGGLWCGVVWCGVVCVCRVGGLVRWVGGMDGMGALGRLGKWVGCGRRSASHTGVFVFPLVHLLLMSVWSPLHASCVRCLLLLASVYIVCVYMCVLIHGICFSFCSPFVDVCVVITSCLCVRCLFLLVFVYIVCVYVY